MIQIRYLNHFKDLEKILPKRNLSIIFISNEYIEMDNKQSVNEELESFIFSQSEIVNIIIYYDNVDDIEKYINIIKLIIEEENINELRFNFLTRRNDFKEIVNLLNKYNFKEEVYYFIFKYYYHGTLKLGYSSY